MRRVDIEDGHVIALPMPVEIEQRLVEFFDEGFAVGESQDGNLAMLNMNTGDAIAEVPLTEDRIESVKRLFEMIDSKRAKNS